jgi:hypothetical protein
MALISPHYSDKVLNIMTELRAINVRKVWITSRRHGEYVENEISSRLEAYRLIMESRFACPNDVRSMLAGA